MPEIEDGFKGDKDKPNHDQMVEKFMEPGVGQRTEDLGQVLEFRPRTGQVESAATEVDPESAARAERAMRRGSQGNISEASDVSSERSKKKEWSRLRKGLAIAGSVIVGAGAIDVAEGGGFDKTRAVGEGITGISKKVYNEADEFFNDTYEERRDRFTEKLQEESESKSAVHTLAGDREAKEINNKLELIRSIDSSNLNDQQKKRALETVVFSEVPVYDEKKAFNPRMNDMVNHIENPPEELNKAYFYDRIPKQIKDPETGEMVSLSNEEREKRAELASEVVKSDLGALPKGIIVVQAMESVNFSLNKLEAPDTA
ncbi:hypothetical protein C4544_05565 [candidate division WS5 bacterium]|uniref:Uncharacterized protein n=1 Tax=candidate division WS5 bacterium TaxID=2093353 RepID=A0A419DAU3_9BACT|nr:MAG: hypothetical protein C4544_05565 [candidate division WS5 bacterium]